MKSPYKKGQRLIVTNVIDMSITHGPTIPLDTILTVVGNHRDGTVKVDCGKYSKYNFDVERLAHHTEKLSSLSFEMPESRFIETIKDLLCSALEGGSNYWYRELEVVGKPTAKEYCYHEVPFFDGCYLKLKDAENNDKEHTITKEKLLAGLQTMANNAAPHHIFSVLRENADAETGDVFLQCVLFGEVLYG